MKQGIFQTAESWPVALSAKAIIISSPTTIKPELSAQANIHFYSRNITKQGGKSPTIALAISNSW